jgi:signal transduction histidine kinase
MALAETMKKYLLPLSFSLIILLMIVVASISVFRMATISDRMENLVNERNVKVNNIMTMYVSARERSLSLLKMLNLEDPFEREDEFEIFNEQATKFSVARMSLIALDNSEKETELIERHLGYVQIAVPLQMQVVDLLFDEQFEQAGDLLLKTGIPAQNKVLDHLTRMLEYQDLAARESLKDSEELNRKTAQYVYILTILSVLLSIVVAIYVIRTLKKDEAELQNYSETLEQRVKERTNKLKEAFQDLKTSQAQLVQSEKMASLGLLTAGIAHEIKNPLNFINNFSETSRESLDELQMFLSAKQKPLEVEEQQELQDIFSDILSDLEKIKSHGDRADSIVRSMLLHSRENKGEYDTLDINQLAEESLNLAYHSERARDSSFNVTLNRDLSPNSLNVNVDSLEISRVLINLISNSFYATQCKSKEGETGYQPEITVTTRSTDGNIEVSVSDNGIGMDEKIVEKAFNPFFTTKPPGEGTGLGLSMSYDIITKQYGGKMAVSSKPGEGTKFTFSLKQAS